MTERRANELRRHIHETLAGSNGNVDDWTARELRRAERRLAKIERAERNERRAREYAQRQADTFALAGDAEAAAYWQAIADGAYTRRETDAMPDLGGGIGNVGAALVRAERRGRNGGR